MDKQRGFTLIELSIVMIIMMMATAWGLWAKVNAVREENAQVQGDAMVTLANSVGTYETTYYTELVNNTAIPGFADIYAPTIPELIAAGLLHNNFSTSNFYGSNYNIALSRVPAGCVPPLCDVSFLVNLTGPITDYRTGLVDGPTLGAAVRRMGADGGFSNRVAAGTINGASGSWSAPNPVVNGSGQPVPGILAIRGGYGSSGWAQFLRRDGTLPMTGALNMGNQNINNAATLNSNAINNATSIATTTIATTDAVTVGGTLNVAGATTTNGITNTGDISNTGILNTLTLNTTGGATIGTTLNVTGATTTNGITNTGNITNTGAIFNTGNVTVTGDVSSARLLLTYVVNNGAACAGLDGYQARTAAGSIASCINSVWTTPNATTAATPCAAQAVTWGAGCWANIGAKNSGDTTAVTPGSPSGATGSATFLCAGGVQILQPTPASTCTLPPCGAQTLTWGGGCQASFPGGTASGSTATRTATTGTGSATYLCTAGSWAFQSGSCTPPAAKCLSGTQFTWAQNQGVWGGNSAMASTYNCRGSITRDLAGTGDSQSGISNINSYRTGTGTAICNNGVLSGSGTCDGQYRMPTTQMMPAPDYALCSYNSVKAQDVWNWYITELKRIPDRNGYANICAYYASTGWNSVTTLQYFRSISSEYGTAQAIGHITQQAEDNVCGYGWGYPWTAYNGNYPVSGSPQQSYNSTSCKFRPQ